MLTMIFAVFTSENTQKNNRPNFVLLKNSALCFLIQRHGANKKTFYSLLKLLTGLTTAAFIL